MKELTEQIEEKLKVLGRKFEEIQEVKGGLEKEKDEIRVELAELLNEDYPSFLEEHKEIVETEFEASTGEHPLETITLLIVTKKSRSEIGDQKYVDYQKEIIKDVEEELDDLYEKLDMMVGNYFFGEKALKKRGMSSKGDQSD